MGFGRRWLLNLVGFALCSVATALSQSAHAAEGAHGVWLLGLNGSPGAGITPPPGIFFSNTVYYYSGSADASRSIPVDGKVVAGIDVKIRLDLVSGMWVTPVQVLGGNLYFTALVPIGGPIVDAQASTTPPLPAVTLNQRDSIFTVGDPVAGTGIGWHSGHFHWRFGVTGFFPVGDYRQGALANVSNNRLSADINAAFTWFDPAVGLDLSAVMGVTFNDKNEATNYKTGNEFHLEWAVTKNLTKQFSIGAVGYYYNQLTGDSGTGATLGAFKGEVTALGGQIGYSFMLGALPVATKLRVYREFNVKNRLEGTAAFFNLSFPLHVNAPPTPKTAMVTK